MLASLLFGGLASAPTLADFEAILAANDSATKALGEWCAVNRIADPANIRAQHIQGRSARPPARLRHLLDLPESEQPGYRHVRLVCGETVLSEAHNWYVRSRLTPEMNAALESTDMPFGKVAASLRFRREPLATLKGRAAPCPAGTVSTHRALLRLPDGQPLALVMECYTLANLR